MKMVDNGFTCIALSALFILCLFTDPVLSEEIKSDKGLKCPSGIEFLTGYGHGRLRSKENYRLYPLFIDLDFNLKHAGVNKSNTYPGLLQFIIEPFYSYVRKPDSNMEIGNNFVIKVGIIPENVRFQPYLKCSAGLIYISQHTREQATHFNFNEYAGAGAHYFFRKDIALTMEYRFRHISNAGIKHPNTGINTNFTVCGVSFVF